MGLFDFIFDNDALDEISVDELEFDNSGDDIDDEVIDDGFMTQDVFEDVELGDFNVAGDYHDSNDEMDVEQSYHHQEHTNIEGKRNNSNSISFKGNGRCRVCGCGKWAGYGDTCANCGHFYDKHI